MLLSSFYIIVLISECFCVVWDWGEGEGRGWWDLLGGLVCYSSCYSVS